MNMFLLQTIELKGLMKNMFVYDWLIYLVYDTNKDELITSR